MNKHRAKGLRTQRDLIKRLEYEGWRVAIVERTGQYIQEKDMFGLFDLVSINTKGESRFIQVKTNRPGKHGDYEEFSSKYRIPCYQYVKKDYCGWKIFKYDKGVRSIILNEWVDKQK